jgi:pimeloyl-ACP methyl ester carboxylesterase
MPANERFIGCFLVLVALSAVLFVPAEASAALFERSACPFDPHDTGVRCGYLSVPAQHAHPDGSRIRIAVAIYPPHGKERRVDPVFFLGGGPGYPTLGSDDGTAIRPIRATGRTLVEIDQRGLGFSRPQLGCKELSDLQFVEPDVALAGSAEEAVLNYGPGRPMARALSAARACRTRLARTGIDLAAFNSDESADDVEDLRAALGYATIDLFGTSYGTRLALVVIRRHPGHIRAVVLDSPFPLQMGAKDTGAETVEAYSALFHFCAANPTCHARHPDLEREVIAVAAALNASPREIVVHPQASNAPREVKAKVTGDTFLAVLAYGLSYADGTVLPDMIGEVEQGRFERFARFYGTLFDTGSAYGMHYTVECREDEDFSPPSVLNADARSLPNYLRGPFLRGQIGDWNMCRAWNVPEAAASFRRPVRSDMPTLVLSGGLDWSTPPSWARLAVDGLRHATLVTFPRLGHQTYFGGDCPKKVVAAFLAKPNKVPEHGCADESRP